MTDYRSLLEHDLRLAGPAGFSFDDLARRRNRKQRNQRLGTAALALIVAAVTIGFLIRAFASQEAPRPAERPTSSSIWSRYPLGEMRTSAITAGGPGLVAVGWNDRGAAVWISWDGRTWTPVPGEELGPGTISDVTTGGPGLVAVGTTDNESARISGTQTEGPTHGVVWTSEDGRTWTRLPDDPAFRGAMFGASAVTAGGPGVVAVGNENRAWFSSDGTAWEPATVPPVPEGVYPGDDGMRPQVHLSDVAASSDRLVAIGWAMMNDNSEVPVIWTSADGMSWTDVSLDPEVFPRGGTIAELTHGPNGFVAVGGLDDVTQPAVWRSADGLRWHRVSSEAFTSRVDMPGRSSAMWSVAASESGYVAVGVDGDCPDGAECGSAEAAIWTSTDGESWVRVPPGDMFRAGPDAGNEGSYASHVVAWGSRFVVKGEYDGLGALWVSGDQG